MCMAGEGWIRKTSTPPPKVGTESEGQGACLLSPLSAPPPTPNRLFDVVLTGVAANRCWVSADDIVAARCTTFSKKAP